MKTLKIIGKYVKKIEESTPLWFTVDTILGIIVVVGFFYYIVNIF